MCIRYVEITLTVSIKTCKEVTQLVSTSNKRSLSGEMKIDLKRVSLYRGDGLDNLQDQRWTVKFNIHTLHEGCLINDQCHLWVWGKLGKLTLNIIVLHIVTNLSISKPYDLNFVLFIQLTPFKTIRPNFIYVYPIDSFQDHLT